ncbi:MAG: YciI family protein [Stellaceae bacterium]
MMRFMVLVYPEGFDKAEPDFAPPPESVAAMMKFNEELQKAGVLLSLDGLHPPTMGARVRFGDGSPKVTYGPFPESRESLGGHWMIRVNSLDDAIGWMKRCPMYGNCVVEIRQLYEMEEFPDDVRAAAGDAPARLKETLEGKAE